MKDEVAFCILKWGICPTISDVALNKLLMPSNISIIDKVKFSFLKSPTNPSTEEDYTYQANLFALIL